MKVWARGPVVGVAALGAALALASLPAIPASAAETAVSAESADVERLIVRFAPGVKPWTADGEVAAQDFVDVDLDPGRWIGFGYRTVELAQPVSESEAADIAAELESSPEVVHAEPVTRVRLANESPGSIPLKSQAIQAAPPWGLDRIDQRALPLDDSYGYGREGTGVRAYVVDTGILATHVEFEGRVASGVSFINDNFGTSDFNGHGTHVAGTIGGKSTGVAKNITLVPVRIFTCGGDSDTLLLLQALQWIKLNHPAGTPGVINLSLGADSVVEAVDSAIRDLVANNLIVVAASGNDNQDACLTSPGREPLAITVNASTRDDTRASFSNFGSCTDIYAPGVGISSASHLSNTALRDESGTSMAAPHVTGIVGRILQRNANLTPQQVWEVIRDDSTPFDPRPSDATDAKGLIALTVEPPSAPDPPTSVAVSLTDQQVHVSWTPPRWDGGGIDSYTATASPGNLT